MIFYDLNTMKTPICPQTNDFKSRFNKIPLEYYVLKLRRKDISNPW